MFRRIQLLALVIGLFAGVSASTVQAEEINLRKVSIGQRQPLTNIADVHEAFQAGNTTGSTLLVP